ncbi:insulinase family protein, partial [bacterium]|nr:insulinase family protein [bacterium]
EAAFTEHPYYPTTIGLPEVIKATTLEKLVTFYEERYRPNQIIMALVGDFDTDDMIARIDREFGKYESGPISFELGRREPEQTAFRQTASQMETSGCYLLFGYHIPPTASSDMAPLTVLSEILGGNDNARLQSVLQREKNLVTSLYVWPDFLKDAALLYIGMTCSPEFEEEAVSKTLAAIRKLSDEGVTSDELAAAKEKLIVADIMEKETFRGRAENICHNVIAGAPSLADNYPKLIEAVTAEDVRRVVRKYLAPNKATLSLIVPEGEEIRDYSTLVRGATLRLDGQIDPQADLPIVKPKFIKPISMPSKTFHRTLANGITLVGYPDAQSQTVCVSVFAKGGQWLEEGKAGLGYLTAAMLDDGTRQYSKAQIDSIKASLSIDFWNTASEDYITIGFNGLSRDFDEAMKLLTQMLFQSIFPDAEFEKAKLEQTHAIGAVEDQPWEYTHREALEDLYKRSPYRNLVVGTKEDIRNIRIGDIRMYHSLITMPTNLVVSVAGKFDAGTIAKLLEGFGPRLVEGQNPPPPKMPLVLDKPPKKISRRLEYKEKDQNTFNISFLTVGVDHPDYLPMALATRILNTRLFFKYVYDKGMAYRMWSRMYPRLGQARFYFEMGCSDENFKIAVPGILQDLDDFLHEDVSEEILEIAKKDEITRNRMQFQTNREIADGLGYWEMIGLGYEFFDRFPEYVNPITAEQVEEAARRYLSVDRYQLVNVGTAKVK